MKIVETDIAATPIAKLESVWDYLDTATGLQFFSLGRQPYQPVWDLQKKLHTKRVSGEIPDVILYVEHEPVYTFGKNAERKYLLDSQALNADVVQIDRGGEVTYHGPGQLVCYPIIDLHDYKLSISWYMRTLEIIVMEYLQQLGVNPSRKEGMTGVWVEDEKICAMGVRLAKWVTMHGFALNINPDMTYFDKMIPCGIFEYGVTSLRELKITVDQNQLLNSLTDLFNYYLSREKNEI
ncbi:MAG: lipoyl(octanoyl) transferase LipB [Candidatus Marinimicrobia bacterium]|nr:lipoyl(octanoyl) transferase LipB [Candidatus Neomarinimicrobiota bacterium]